MTGPTSHLAVGAIVRRGSDILLVSERNTVDPEPIWALPGGMISATEPVRSALCRRVADETGLTAITPGRMLWLARYAVGGELFQAVGFDVLAEGEPQADDVAWVGLDDALGRLAQMWFAPLRDPALAYLTGRAAVATLWTWARPDAPAQTVPGLDLPSRSI